GRSDNAQVPAYPAHTQLCPPTGRTASCDVDCLPCTLAVLSTLTAALRGGEVGVTASAASPRCPVWVRSPGTFALEAGRLGRQGPSTSRSPSGSCRSSQTSGPS